MGVIELASEASRKAMNRRSFVKGVGVAGAGIAAASLIGCGSSVTSVMAQSTTDTAQQIFTAALVAEDLATTMYYNALVGGVIQDANLAGQGGTATSVSSGGSVANVGYLRAALSEEITHANLLRGLIGVPDAAADPYQTFYFPNGTFDNLTNFFPILLALETAFIAAYLTAVQEFSLMAANISPYTSAQVDNTGKAYTTTQLVSFAKIAASIMGVEAEHRTLARAIPSGPTFNGTQTIPADEIAYESTDNLTTVYNGTTSAVAALTPFLASSSVNTGYSLATALAGAPSVQLPSSGNPPM